MTYGREVSFDYGQAGLSPTVTVYQIDRSTVVGGQSGVAMVEFPASSGQYTVGLNFDDAGGYYVITEGSSNFTQSYPPDPGRVTSITTDAVNADALSSDAVNEIQSGLATQANLSIVQAKTDQLTFTVANQVDANALTGGFLAADRTDLQTARKGVTNRNHIDENNNTGTLYEDDKTTPLVVFDLKDIDGNPTNTAVYERDPQ